MRTVLLSWSLLMCHVVAAQMDSLELPFRLHSIEDGLSQGMVNHITQDRNGFMWFSTKDGLNRYDGNNFQVFRNDAEDSTSIAESYSTVVYEDRNGRLWVGTASKGLDVFFPESEIFRHIRLGPGADVGMVMHVVEDLHGNIWVATSKGLFKITFSKVSGSSASQAVVPEYTVRRFFSKQNRVMIDRSGHLWGYMMSMFAFRITPSAGGNDQVDTLDMQRLGSGPWTQDLNTNVNGLFVQDPSNGRMYAVHPYFIAEYDTLTLVPRILQRIPYPEGPRLEAEQMLIDDKGCLWIGSNYFWRFDLAAGTMTRLLPADPNLKSTVESAITVFLDRSGSIWVGTSGYGVLLYDRRIERFNMHPDASLHWMAATPDDRVISLRQWSCMAVYNPRTRSYDMDWWDQDPDVRARFPGMVEETPAAVQDEDGTYWLCKGDLYSLRPGTKDFTHFPIVNEQGIRIARRRGSFPLYQEGNEALWFGCDSAFYRFDKTTQRFTPFRYPLPPVYLPYSFVQAIHQDAQGTFWIATLKGLLRLDPKTGGWWRYHNDPGDPTSISLDMIFSILADPAQPDLYLWLGTNGGGLNRFDMRTGHCDHFTTKEGLPNDVVYGILDDEQGNLWMSTNKGISRFTPSTRVFRNYDASDGLQSDEFNRNAFCKLKDGTLFFGGVRGFNSFNPKDLRDDPRAVDVRITDIKIMNRSIAFNEAGSPLRAPAYLSEGMEIPHDANMVTFEFAAMEYAAPERHQYRYKLEGFDPDWITVGANNTAIYTNLDPGTYTFRVRGANRDGIWDEVGTAFRLVVRPPWYMTAWFFALCAIVIIGGTFLYILSLRMQKRKLERTIRHRTHELRHAKERSDELLNNILPAGVATELKQMGHAEARHYEQVSILFSDFKDFTGVSERLSPAELVEELNVCFNAFDRIMEKHGVEKIKTIGDAYMAAGGIPDPARGGPLATVRAALEMQGIMAERQIERRANGKPAFEMRVGIHTGHVVAGIVGQRKFQYDIWGDTVNTASRMESSGEVGEVNLSGTTYDLVKDSGDLNFIARGRMQVKGKGEMEMYFVRYDPARPRTGSRPNLVGPGTNGAPGAVVPEGRSTQATTGSHSAELKNLRILLAEDNSFNVMVAQDELEFAIPGVKVDVAVNGAEAVAMVKKNVYDLILMDVQMPGMDGYQATRAIRAMPGAKAGYPIVALTANVMQAEVDRCMEAGMDAFVPKPFKREELIGTLRKVLSKTRARS